MLQTDQNNWNEIGRSINSFEANPEGAAANMQGSWNKLEQRLAKKKPTQMFAWWLLAAASITLLLVSVVFNWSGERKLQPVVLQKQTPSTSTEGVAAVPTNEVAGSTHPSTPATLIQKKRAKKSSVDVQATIILNDSTAIQSMPVPVSAETVASVFPAPDSNAATPMMASRKTLRIVHNNMLNTRVPSLNDYMARAASTEKPSPGWIFSHNASDNVLQIKISSTQ